MYSESSERQTKQNGMALISILLSVAGCLLAYFVKIGGETFGLGQIAAFVAVLMSLMSVKDKGSNLPAMAAFWISFAALFLSVGIAAVK